MNKKLTKLTACLLSLVMLAVPGRAMSASALVPADTTVLSAEADTEINLNVWISDTPGGADPGCYYAGHTYYLCYELTYADTGERLPVTEDEQYSVYLEIAAPDDSVVIRETYTSDQYTDDGFSGQYHWIVSEMDTLGEWSGFVLVAGNGLVIPEILYWNITNPLAGGDRFIWGEDNFGFDNSRESFPYGHAIDADIRDTLTETYMSNQFFVDLFKAREAKNRYTSFGGACYGTTLAQILMKQGALDLTAFGGAETANASANTPEILSVLNFLFETQDCPVAGEPLRYSTTTAYHETFTQDTIMEGLADALLNRDKLINICFNIGEYDASGNRIGWGGHSILGYGVEECRYYSEITKKTYDRRILTADPNHLDRNRLNDEACLYYNSEDFSWMIPAYNYTRSDSSFRRCYWNAEDGAKRNYGFIKCGIQYVTGTDGGITAWNVMKEAMVSPQYYGAVDIYTENGAGVSLESYSRKAVAASGPDENILSEKLGAENGQLAHISWILSGRGDRLVTFGEPSATYGFVIDHQRVGFSGDVTNASEMLVHFDGGLELSGEDMVYDVGLTGYMADWCTVRVTGGGTDSLVFTQTKEGYVLTADTLNDIGVYVTQYDYPAVSTVFSSCYETVLLYEIDTETIGVAADADGDGTFDTDIIGNRFGREELLLPGDVNGDGEIDASDAAAVLYEAALIGTGQAGMFSDEQNRAADFNGDGEVNAGDAAAILEYSASAGAGAV